MRKIPKVRTIVILLMLLLLDLTFIESTSSADDPRREYLNIYVSVSLSGPDAYEGLAIKEAAELFVKEKNKHGGLRGRYLRVIAQDDFRDVGSAGDNARQALADPNHLLTIGSPHSRIALPVSKLYANQEKLYFTIFATNKNIGKQGKTIFQSAYNDEFQGAVLANFAYNKLRARNILIVTNRSDPYSEGLSNEFMKGLKKQSDINITQFNFITGPMNTQQLIHLLSEQKPDLVFVPILAEKAAEIVKILATNRQPGLRILGSDGWGVQTHIQSIIQSTIPDGKDERYYYTFFWHPDVKTSLSRRIMNLYSSNSLPQPYVASIFTIELLSIVFAASEQARTIQPNLLAKQIRSRTWDGATGKIYFAQSGVTYRPIMLLELSRAGLHLNSIIEPTY